MESKEIKVGIGDLNTALSPDKLITIGLGSCVGIALYDGIKRIAGLAHIMLPESSKFTNNTNPMKYADLAIPMLLDRMFELGAKKQILSLKLQVEPACFKLAINHH